MHFTPIFVKGGAQDSTTFDGAVKKRTCFSLKDARTFGINSYFWVEEAFASFLLDLCSGDLYGILVGYHGPFVDSDLVPR